MAFGRIGEGIDLMKSQSLELGSLLIQEGLITPAQLGSALAEQARTHERLGEILCRSRYINQDDLLGALSRQFELRRFDPSKDVIEIGALAQVPVEFARRHNVL